MSTMLQPAVLLAGLATGVGFKRRLRSAGLLGAVFTTGILLRLAVAELTHDLVHR